jgi:SAM-dependent methyltransferase
MNACKVCGNTSGNKIHTAREMMFGLRHPFEYLECGNCGCVQLMKAPEDMARYYPKDYYSFQHHGWVMTAIRRRWSAYARGQRSLVGWFVNELYYPNNAMKGVHRLGLRKNARILEIGSGSGRLLQDLCYFGFTDVKGVDPYIEKDLRYENGPVIYKKQLAEMEGEFDIIMLNHAFEHMDQPAATMHDIGRLLAKEGKAIIRIPVSSSYGWKHYGVNWVHLDAPRHLFIHSFKSMEILAKGAGLKISEIIHEAEEISIVGSEAYTRDIPMFDLRYPLVSSKKRLLAWRRRRVDKEAAEAMNRRCEADLICFYLVKAN